MDKYLKKIEFLAMCIVCISEYICQLINFLVEKLVGGDGGGSTRGGSAECGITNFEKTQDQFCTTKLP